MPNILRWAAAVVVLAMPASLQAQEAVVELDTAQTRIEFTLPEALHAVVHGTFKLKSGTIRFNPATGAARGLLVLDMESEETGNASLDRKIHKEVLESRKYPEATFTPLQVIGRLEPQGESPLQLSGSFNIHGYEHDLNLAVTAQMNGDQLTASTHVLIPYVDWGLKNPSSLLTHVGSQVEINVRTVGRISRPRTPK